MGVGFGDRCMQEHNPQGILDFVVVPVVSDAGSTLMLMLELVLVLAQARVQARVLVLVV